MDTKKTTAESKLSFASQATYNKVKSSGNGKAVTPVNGDNSKGVNQLDSNMILKVTRDRECSEWLSFETNIGGSESRYISTSKEFSLNNNNSNIRTCTSLNEDKTCNTIGSGYEENLDVKQYISVMKGEWANNDFSGFAIPNLKSVDKAGWADRSIVAGSTSIFTANEKYAKNQVCKSYPESDSPYNFSDKYEIKLRKCNNSSNQIGVVGSVSGEGWTCDAKEYDLVEVNRNQALWESGNCNDWCVVKDKTTVYSDRTKKKVLAFTYEQFKEFVPRRYFGDTVKSGITLPYENNHGPANEFLIWIDDNQECYYQKFTYNSKPVDMYFGDNSWNLPTGVCYTVNSSGQGGDSSINKCKEGDSKSFISKEKTTVNNIGSDSRRGYCIEYSYSNEIYYPNSGKYNCITWIPGFIK